MNNIKSAYFVYEDVHFAIQGQFSLHSNNLSLLSLHLLVLLIMMVMVLVILMMIYGFI